MSKDTISGIIGITEQVDAEEQPLDKRIITMYDSLVSEELYDTDEIAHEIVKTLVADNAMKLLWAPLSSQASCRLIYDVFNICKTHVRELSERHHREQFATDLCNNFGLASKERLTFK